MGEVFFLFFLFEVNIQCALNGSLNMQIGISEGLILLIVSMHAISKLHRKSRVLFVIQNCYQLFCKHFVVCVLLYVKQFKLDAFKIHSGVLFACCCLCFIHFFSEGGSHKKIRP